MASLQLLPHMLRLVDLKSAQVSAMLQAVADLLCFLCVLLDCLRREVLCLSHVKGSGWVCCYAQVTVPRAMCLCACCVRARVCGAASAACTHSCVCVLLCVRAAAACRRRQVGVSLLTTAVSTVGAPLFALAGSGLFHGAAAAGATAGGGAGVPRLGATTRAGCAVMRHFLRLLRVAVENRSAFDLVPATCDLCLGADMRALVLAPALVSDLAPAYFGLLRQVPVLPCWWGFLHASPLGARAVSGYCCRGDWVGCDGDWVGCTRTPASSPNPSRLCLHEGGWARCLPSLSVRTDFFGALAQVCGFGAAIVDQHGAARADVFV
jgi:hypothetical protein